MKSARTGSTPGGGGGDPNAVAECSFEPVKARSALMDAIFESAYLWQMATAAGHSVLDDVDAETGLRLAHGEQPDRILRDIELPSMDGLAAAAVLNHESATVSIPDIALCALSMKADEERSQVAGCDAYIVKPLRNKELYAVIGRLLAQPEPANEQAAPPGLWPS